jgi:hypothetical protein
MALCARGDFAAHFRSVHPGAGFLTVRQVYGRIRPVSEILTPFLRSSIWSIWRVSKHSRISTKASYLMKPIIKWSWSVGLVAAVAALVVAIPSARKQYKLAYQRAAILKMPVIDFFPSPKNDGRQKLLVMIANRSNEEITPVEFSVIEPNGNSQINPIGTSNIVGQPIAPASIGVVLAEYTAFEDPAISPVTMTAKIKYLGLSERIEMLLVTRRLN